MYLEREELSRLIRLKYPNQIPIAYCVGGVRSALLSIIIEARMGIVTANYDGSIWEWASDPKLPLVI